MNKQSKPGMRAVPIVQNGRSVTSWSRQKLESEMRKAGWQSLGQGVWTHPDCPGFNLQLFSFDRASGRELWHRYAEANAVPKSEDFR